ncbi:MULTISPECIES: hypothetical protein [Flavobacterium]|uniref:hypothetical protein n=1 Tax=Flavobacterium TaxID=237 RepID=UPI001FCC6565|nr:MULTISPECIES: hypothetical protein [Flavobacterium]UOK41613.1 hypothetical protein LZF87_09850 [Flavobacterium enshiense]
MLRYLYLITFIFLLISCETREELASKKLIGQWAIYEMSYNGKDCKDDLLVNYIMFYEKKFAIPEIYNYLAEDETDNTQWNLSFDNQKVAKLNLKCQNKIFNGPYELIYFKNHQEKLLGIKLKSKTTSIVAYKLLQNFDSYRNWDTEY